MSISSALSNAMTGLNAAARGTAVVSANIANAMNESYGRRDVQLSTNGGAAGGGVQVVSVQRHVNAVSLDQRRLAQADFANADTLSKFANTLETIIGSIDTATSLASHVTEFETALLSAANDPSSSIRLGQLSAAAEKVAGSLNLASRSLQTERVIADTAIAQAVEQINRDLAQVDQLNDQIAQARLTGADVNGYMDQRDATIDRLSEFVPLRVIERDTGAVSLFTARGKSLLDGKPEFLDFSPTQTIDAHMRVDNGFLSSLEIDGRQYDPSSNGFFQGGKLAALFQVRDVETVGVQANLDAIARDLIERFEAGGPDTTLAVGTPGIFTDQGNILDPTQEIGLAGRVGLNSLLATGSSEQWRWRDGLGAPAEGDVGASQLLTAIKQTLDQPMVAASANLQGSKSVFGRFQQMTTQATAQRVASSTEADLAYETLQTRREVSNQDGVNTDAELQRLIELEKAYSANARVLSVADEMLEDLLRI